MIGSAIPHMEVCRYTVAILDRFVFAVYEMNKSRSY